MNAKIAVLAATFSLAATGAFAQTKTYLVHFDGSCLGMRLKIFNGYNVHGNTIGCGETKRLYVGTIKQGDVADVNNVNSAEDLVKLNYVIGLRNHTWVLYETLDGKTEEIGNGFWTKQGPEVTVESVPGVTPPPGAAPAQPQKK